MLLYIFIYLSIFTSIYLHYRDVCVCGFFALILTCSAVKHVIYVYKCTHVYILCRCSRVLFCALSLTYSAVAIEIDLFHEFLKFFRRRLLAHLLHRVLHEDNEKRDKQEEGTDRQTDRKAVGKRGSIEERRREERESTPVSKYPAPLLSSLFLCRHHNI